TSTFNISGNIRNLHTPDRLFLDVLVGDSKFDPSDANKLMPRFDLPRFDSLGQLSFFSEFVGNPWNFKSQTTLKGRCGGIVMNGNLTLDRPLPTYDATFTTNSLNLGMVLGNKKLQTFLNAKGKVSGRGFSIDNMTANLKMTADSSRFQKADISTAEVSINALPHRLEGAVVLTAREMRATLRAHADFTDAKLPRFGGDVGLISFDLANILNNKEYASNLTLRAKLSGSGHNIDDMSGDVTLELLPSTFQDRDLSEETVHIILDQQTPDDKHLSLLVRPHTEAERQMNFDYIMNIKNLEPIASLLGGSPFDARANLKGTMKGTVDRLSLSCAGTFDEFYVGTVKGGILLNTGTIDLQANSLSDINTLEQLTGTLDCSFSSGLLNTTSLTGLQVNVKYNNLAGDFGASGIIDSTYAIQLLGKTSVQTHTYVFDLDTLRVSLGNYAWQNEQDVQFRLNLDGVRVMHAVMKRNDETFSTAGILHPSGDFDFDASLRKFDLSGINIWSRAADLAEPGRGFAGHADADVHLGGSMSVPVIRFNAFSEDTYFLQTHIGQVIASIDYSSQSAVIDVNVKTSSSDSVNSLVIKGTLPINLAFTDVEERFPDQEQHLQVLSEGFDLNVLDPLLPDFENLTGRLRSNLTLNGTPRNPRYAGTISLRDVRFIFGPNNIGYIVSGDLEPSGDQIMLKSFTVTNVPEKGLNGEAHFTGSIAIKNFEIASFDLTAFGQLLLMTAATRKTVPTMYGTLFAEIGGDGLRVTGSLDHPFLSGKLLIREANLVFPPTTKTGTMNSNLKLNYIVVDDSSRKSPLEQKHSKFYLVGDSANEAVLLNTPRYESPILERLRYNLSIETQGTTAMRMVFTPATNEELYAELEGKVTAVNNQGTPTIYGEISVSPRSYYNFFKKFDATGKLNFTGQWDNPELDIYATYEGYRQVDEATLTSQPNADEKPLTEQKVIVELKITGKRYEPKLDMSMKVQRRRGEDPEDWSRQAKGGDVQSDAISFILTGKFREDLTSSERQNIASNFGSAGVSGFTSNLLSGILTDFLRQEFPFIRSAEFTYGGTGGLQENADLRLSGEAFKGYFRFGGKILNNLGNANVTYQLNVGDVFNSRSIRNLFLEFERRVEGSEATNEDKTTNATNSARLYYRFSF
ncbi:MAG: translocation/assembly module TamB domain-containing protein, partial [Ignavibacteriales bacterium]|nr:translocation/assembly module TamB domain-containing protein [Ignavibacteriales bacterium]